MIKKIFAGTALFIMVCVHMIAQEQPIIGYDKVKWGASVSDVRRAYSINNNILLEIDKEDTNYADIVQKNVSENIVERIFMFNKWNAKDYQLYRVIVNYKGYIPSNKVGDPPGLGEILVDSLRQKYGEFIYKGEIRSETQEVNGKHYFPIRWECEYSPDLTVSENSVPIPASFEEAGRYFALKYYYSVIYTWKSYRDAYQKAITPPPQKIEL